MREDEFEDLQVFERLQSGLPVEAESYHAYVRRKISEGLADAMAGRLIPQEEAELRMNKWIIGENDDV